MHQPTRARAPKDGRIRSALRTLLESEASGGLVLMGGAAVALVVANSPAAPVYVESLNVYVLGLSILHWINDALMALFFLLVGLEVKREMLDGQLSTWPRRALPGVAAVGGMIVPAFIYVALNWSTPDKLPGWAIPSSTDIAFALGVLSLLGPRVPVSLKLFLTTLAILDDLGAIAIIALFYTADLSVLMLGLGSVTLLVLAGLNWRGVDRLWPYLLIGVVLWLFTLKSGIHATLAGVALAFTIPLQRTPGRPEASGRPLIRLERRLQPWVAFAIVPIFGFANAGVSFAGVSVSGLLDPVLYGIALGLFVGKQLGVFAFAWAAIRLGLAELPARASWTHLYGVALICGIGFTMSLFIGMLAFPTSRELQDTVKIGVLAGSLASALIGAALLRVSPAHHQRHRVH
jgi:Na+:H+ antiporter, NhaA family